MGMSLKNSALLQLVMHTTSVTIIDKIPLILHTHSHCITICTYMSHNETKTIHINNNKFSQLSYTHLTHCSLDYIHYNQPTIHTYPFNPINTSNLGSLLHNFGLNYTNCNNAYTYLTRVHQCKILGLQYLNTNTFHTSTRFQPHQQNS